MTNYRAKIFHSLTQTNKLISIVCGCQLKDLPGGQRGPDTVEYRSFSGKNRYIGHFFLYRKSPAYFLFIFVFFNRQHTHESHKEDPNHVPND